MRLASLTYSSTVPTPDYTGGAVSLFLGLAVLVVQIRAERVQALIEVGGELVGPAHDLSQRPRAQMIEPTAPIAAHRDQSGLFENREVLRDGPEAHVEGRGEFAGGALASPERDQDRPSCGMRDRVEDVIVLLGAHACSIPGRLREA